VGKNSEDTVTPHLQPAHFVVLVDPSEHKEHAHA